MSDMGLGHPLLNLNSLMHTCVQSVALIIPSATPNDAVRSEFSKFCVFQKPPLYSGNCFVGSFSEGGLLSDHNVGL